MRVSLARRRAIAGGGSGFRGWRCESSSLSGYNRCWTERGVLAIGGVERAAAGDRLIEFLTPVLLGQVGL